MAADLVANPTAPQDSVHDLESMFWVLLWATIKYMHTNWNESTCSSFLKTIMSPDTYCSMGGHQKSMWMIADGLGLPELEVSLCFQLTLLLAQLKAQLSVQYKKKPTKSSYDFLGQYKVLRVAEETEKIKKAKAALGHKVIIFTFNDHLKKEGWPIDDAANPQPIVVSDAMMCKRGTSSKRSWAAARLNGVFGDSKWVECG
jgi:hypothetical protein